MRITVVKVALSIIEDWERTVYSCQVDQRKRILSKTQETGFQKKDIFQSRGFLFLHESVYHFSLSFYPSFWSWIYGRSKTGISLLHLPSDLQEERHHLFVVHRRDLLLIETAFILPFSVSLVKQYPFSLHWSSQVLCLQDDIESKKMMRDTCSLKNSRILRSLTFLLSTPHGYVFIVSPVSASRVLYSLSLLKEFLRDRILFGHLIIRLELKSDCLLCQKIVSITFLLVVFITEENCLSFSFERRNNSTSITFSNVFCRAAQKERFVWR